MYQAHHATRLDRAVAERRAAIAANRHKLTLLDLADSAGAATAAPAPQEPAGRAADIEAWARHAQAANGFGGADSAFPSGPMHAVEPARTDGTAASAPPATGLHALLLAGRDFVRRLAERAAQRRAARRTISALNDLDSRTLRDLGFDPSEIGSVAGEAAGLADATRVRVLTAQGALGA